MDRSDGLVARWEAAAVDREERRSVHQDGSRCAVSGWARRL